MPDPLHAGAYQLENIHKRRMKPINGHVLGVRGIVVISSIAHKRVKEINFDDINSTQSYDRKIAYGQSKLANNLFTIALHKRLTGTNVTVNCLHPGIIYTELGRYMEIPLWKKIIFVPVALLILKTPWQGAQTTIYCAVDKEVDEVSGLYFVDCKRKQPALQALDELAAEKLWSLSVKLTEL